MTLLRVLLGWAGLSVVAAVLWCALLTGAEQERRDPRRQAVRPHAGAVPPQRRWDDLRSRQGATP